MKTRCSRALLAAVLAVAAARCGGSPTAPVSSTSTATQAPTSSLSAPGGFSVTSVAVSSSVGSFFRVAFIERPIVFTWKTVPGATSYVLDIGTSTSAADVLSIELATTSYTWPQTSMGQFYTWVLAKNGTTTSGTSTPYSLATISLKDYTEALFLGTGPLAESPQGGCPAGVGTMAGWPSGDTVTMTMSTTMNSFQQASLSAAAASVSNATLGTISTTVRTTTNSAPVPAVDEIVATIADPSPCPAGATGCNFPAFRQPGVLKTGKIYSVPLSSIGPFAHETGHALYGFCHINNATAAADISVMGWFNDDGVGLPEADIAAAQAVYGAGLRGGATRPAFLAAGVINSTPTPMATVRRKR